MNIISKAKSFISNLFVKEPVVEEEVFPVENAEALKYAEKTNKYLREVNTRTDKALHQALKERDEAYNVLQEWEDYGKRAKEEMTRMRDYIKGLEDTNVKLRQLYSKALDDKIMAQERLSSALAYNFERDYGVEGPIENE